MKNKNDRPLLLDDIDANKNRLDTFKYFNKFAKVGYLTPNNDKEKVELGYYSDTYKTRRGLVYLFVLDGIILKVGSTTASMKDRIQSYNCGKKAYRDNGTCSTTNYFVLQSFLNMGKVVDVYAYYPEPIEVDVFGEKTESVSNPPKPYENHILTYLKENGEMPILCTQT